MGYFTQILSYLLQIDCFCLFLYVIKLFFLFVFLLSDSPNLSGSKARDLQSTSTLEQFMTKLCVHHQRQIVDAIGFLQTEVKALTSSSTQQDAALGIQGSACSAAKVGVVSPEKTCPELRCPTECNPKSESRDVSNSVQSSCVVKKDSENVVSLKTAVTAGPALDLRSPGSGSNQTLVPHSTNAVDIDNNRHSDHAPLKMKIMASNVADGKKLSCVLNASLSSHSDSLEDREGHSNASRTDAHSARLSSSVKRHSQNHQTRQKDIQGHANETPTKLLSLHLTASPDTPRTARKTVRTCSDNRTRDSACREVVDPDIGLCDIVFIDKPITECFKQRQRGLPPRRNARKSTRGHRYSDECDAWELKTVRTLAGRGNCRTPMTEPISAIGSVIGVTPKQMLSKPEGLPPVDMPFVGACRESLNQQMTTEESDESVLPGTADTVEVAASEVDVVVETSQTGQCQSKVSSLPPSPIRPRAGNEEADLRSDAQMEQNTTADSGMTVVSEEIVAQSLLEAETNNEPEINKGVQESTEQIVAGAEVEPLKSVATEENELPLITEQQPETDAVLEQNSSPSAVNQTDTEEDEREEIVSEQPQEVQAETQTHEYLEATEESSPTGSAEATVVNEADSKASEAADTVMPSGAEDDSDDDYDVSSKTLDALLKELPPWRRKRGTVISLPKRLRQLEMVVVGYVNGRPISASDRSLRRRLNSSTTSPVKSPAKPNRNTANKTVLDSPVESKVENDSLDKNPPQVLTGAASDTQQVKEPSSVTPASPASKGSSKSKQTQKQKKAQTEPNHPSPPADQLVDHSQGSESKRQLRSAGPLSTSVLSSPEPTGSMVLSPTDHSPPPPLVTLPAVDSPPAVVDEQPKQDVVPETIVESHTEETRSVNADSEEIPKNEDDSRLQAKQKLRSSKTPLEESPTESQQPGADKPSPLESQTEILTQVMPLRNKRVLRKDVETSEVAPQQKADVATLGEVSVSADDSVSIADKPTRMPLRSESNKSEMSNQPVTPSTPVDDKKLALRSQRVTAPSTSASSLAVRKNEVASAVRIKAERTSKGHARSSSVSALSEMSHSSAFPVSTQRSEAPKQTTNKFFQMLTGEESQHLITNLNIKFDKMQKGWLQMDKEGQPAAKYKNRADRQAAIWKSKRRAKKTKSLEHQKYSPVQMLFMKGFNLSSICRWFLESTETKSLVIVKKVNTRLPSETQLCFHSSSNSSGTSQGVFPSLQAERLKKHLKKFAIASPVKSNPKSQKLIARALEQEGNAVKGKERREFQVNTQTLSVSRPAESSAQLGESQKSSGKTKNPASARILRKYTNIREKMQGQHTSGRLKEASKTLRTNSIKRLATTKCSAKSSVKPYLRAQKSSLPVSKRMKESAARMERRKTLADKKPTRSSAQERIGKAQSSGRVLRDAAKKELTKRCSQRLGSPKIPEHKPTEASKSKQTPEAEKSDVEKPAANKVNAAKIQTKEPAPETKGAENATESPQQTEAKVPASPDQVLTRSQRKMEAAVPASESPAHALKKATKSMHTQNASPKQVRRAEDSALTRSGALKSSAKKSQTALLPRSAAKSAAKRTQEPAAVPAKRTRTSLLK